MDPTCVEYVPVTHSEHIAFPVVFLYVPATHCVQLLPLAPVDPALQAQSVTKTLAAGALECCGHSLHTSEEAPCAVEYFPTAHGVQTSAPVVILYFPGTHFVHTSPLSPVDPALQEQSSRVWVAAGALELGGHASHKLDCTASKDKNVPEGQLVHTADPAKSLYFPRPHSSQDCPLFPVYPTLHKQSVLRLLCSGASELSGQCKHVFSEIAANDSEYFPSPQRVHKTGPVLALNVPISHCVQIFPFNPLHPALHVQSVILLLPMGEEEPVKHA